MLRIEKIKNTYSEKFQERLEQESVSVSLSSAWNILISSDPSPNKKNVRWMVETYINNGYLWEDIASGPVSKVSETLVEFGRHKRNLEPSERSLNKYLTLGALWSSIKPYVGQMTSNEEKKEERDKAYAEAEVVVDRKDGLKIVVPKTEYAAKWFGRGTRWCTSADKNNMFARYVNQAPLFVIIMPNGDKLQLWKHNSSVQFMDEDDVWVTKEYMEQHQAIIGKLTLFINQFRYYLENQITYDMCVETIKISPINLKYVPEKYKTYDFCLNVVRGYGLSLEYVPEEHKDYNMCQTAIQNHQDAIKFFPKAYLNKEMCLQILKRQGLFLKNVPEEYIDEAMCLEAIKYKGYALVCVPDKYKTRELCEMAVKASGLALNHVSPEYMDYQICLLAVKQNGTALVHVPEKYIDETICKEAVKQFARSLAYVPDRLKTKELCDLALSKDISTIGFSPEEYFDYPTYLEAVKSRVIHLSSIPKQYRTYELCLEALQNNLESWNFVPEKIKESIKTREKRSKLFLKLEQQNKAKEEYSQLQIYQIKKLFQESGE